ncbi:MAG: cyclic nucleotide-binding domain-containing protein [Sulfuritalea sp.]|nr:cyclic nucleotide-binding domain-containing protein [Sulfuritalea sp.]
MQQESSIRMMTILKEFPLFSQLAEQSLAELARTARTSTFHRDQAIYRVGDPVSEMHILVSGQVKLALSCNRGTELIIDLVEAGRSFGEAELFGNDPYQANAIATQASQVLSIARDTLYQVMALNPRVALDVMKLLAQRQIELETELAARHSFSSSHRLLDYFLRLAGPYRDPQGETLVTLGISKQLLAARCSMQPESLSRTLRALIEAGLIAVDGRRIRLKNIAIDRYLADNATAQAFAPPGYAMAAATRSDLASGEPRSLCELINQAGRQRMLSQRMAKSWLMLQRGVLPRRSRVILRQSMTLFDSNLKELHGLASKAGIGSVQAELAELWRPYQLLLDAEPTRRTARELFSVSEDILAAADKLTLTFERIDGTHQGKLVNLAGRERMLSQRMAKLYMFRQMGMQLAKCRMEMDRGNRDFSKNLSQLTAVTGDEPAIAAELERVAKYWDALRSMLAIDDEANFAAAAAQVFTASEDLLRHTDNAVALYAMRPVAGSRDPRHPPSGRSGRRS